MFREMRRKRQLLPTEESVSILEKMTSGTLALHGDDGYPYAVPVSYVYADGKIYFHTAVKGHKVDAIQTNGKVSFCVVEQDDVKPAEFTTYFRSVIAFGKARILEDGNEKLSALRLLADKYSHGEAGMEAEIAKGFNHLLMVEITVEHLTGKESIEFVL
ncbi:MAG: NimABCDEF family nitroimidazole resistance protein [Candidatus Phocaeicola excrementipullorum]|uniref:NimABCDEF family nitroimidazole resistance protein n=1 Tax=Candidatus Phocaeicola excrementipullorum TaxID=2838731 RepID=A0A948TKW9_9BACT|nr:NimABCDEF family nitroimidazole resistance protein [Candidatus Phocaeicola excrementipullorum]